MEHLPEPTTEQVETAARWWISEREPWPLMRALNAWLSTEGGYYWNPEDTDDVQRWERWFEAVLAEARELEQ